MAKRIHKTSDVPDKAPEPARKNGLPASFKLDLKEIVKSANIAPMFDKGVLEGLGATMVDNYLIDLGSREDWEVRNEKAIKLALQTKEEKNFPWNNASNVKFPLLTIAALQFLARISVMTKGKNLAKVESMGVDVGGNKAKQAKRISQHLSMQLTEEDPNWFDQDEEAKFAAALVGASFKKTYYDPVEGVNISEHVPASHFVVSYFCKDINKSPRLTQLLSLSPNEVQERVRRGLFCPMEDQDSTGARAMIYTNILQESADEAQGIDRPVQTADSPYDILEQHLWLDLDADGYEEPYIAFIRLDTAQVVRIVANFFGESDIHRVFDQRVLQMENTISGLSPDDKDRMKKASIIEKQIEALTTSPDNHIVRIDHGLYFTRYLFLPSPDGGVYGQGLGSLLSPLNESVSTLINQLIDSGTMSTTAGGFLGRGVKMKGGRSSFDPFEWKTVDSTGDDLRKNIFPLPVREPSTVLFHLLSMLVSYSEKISGATDIMTGVNPGQNTPAETSRNTIEQGMMLFSGIYNRMYRGFKEELGKFMTLNKLYLESSPRFADLTIGNNTILASDDYTTNSFRVFPSASPEAVSASQQKEKAKELVGLAGSMPGFNKYEVTKRYLEVCGYEDIESIFPDPAGPNAIPQGEDPKIALEKARLELDTQIHADGMQVALKEIEIEAETASAKVVELQAKATKLLADADGLDVGRQIALIDSQIGAAKSKQDGLLKALALMQKAAIEKAKLKGNSSGTDQQGAGKSAPAPAPAPEIAAAAQAGAAATGLATGATAADQQAGIDPAAGSGAVAGGPSPVGAQPGNPGMAGQPPSQPTGMPGGLG